MRLFKKNLNIVNYKIVLCKAFKINTDYQDDKIGRKTRDIQNTKAVRQSF